MNSAQQIDLLNLLKALADKHRLTMISLMGQGQERTVTDMAETLDITEPTVSHHVSKLHEAGLLRLRMAGNQRFYQVNARRLAHLKTLMAEIDAPVVDPEPKVFDNSWIDALDWPEADKKILRDHFTGRQLKQIPTKEKKWLVVLRWLATQFEPDIRYTEKQVNAILTPINEDYAQMRRDLIGFGFMRRERGGGDYWLTPEDEFTGTTA